MTLQGQTSLVFHQMGHWWQRENNSWTCSLPCVIFTKRSLFPCPLREELVPHYISVSQAGNHLPVTATSLILRYQLCPPRELYLPINCCCRANRLSRSYWGGRKGGCATHTVCLSPAGLLPSERKFGTVSHRRFPKRHHLLGADPQISAGLNPNEERVTVITQ